MSTPRPGERRVCPICDATTSAPVCELDRTATLLLDLPPEEAPAPAPGMVIAGRYEIERRIGAGGYGQVFAARHRGTGQNVALKILRPLMDGDHVFATKRFFLEARVTSGLTHPNTVRVFDFGQEDNGLLFIAMELLNGRTLRSEQKARRGVFSEVEAIEIATQVTRSLSEAHDAGLVHRDLKPDNIFLHRAAVDDVVVKVLDFGIAKLGGGHATLSSDTSVPGTPAYMAPEHALNRPVDARTDLYSLGVVLWQLVTGELPFAGASDPQTLYMHAYEPLPSLEAKARTALSPAFEAVIVRALEKDPAQRFASARSMRDALAACVGASPSVVSASEGAGEMHVSHMSTPVAGTGFVPPVRATPKWPLSVVALLLFGSAVAAYWVQRGPGPGVERARSVEPARAVVPATVDVAPDTPAEPAEPAVESVSRDGGAPPAVDPAPPPEDVAPKKTKRRRVRRRRAPKTARPETPKKPDPRLEMRLEDLIEEKSP
ncbi:MAG: serine/threonine-protein kinase [Deltaproteobacteria bacterium]